MYHKDEDECVKREKETGGEERKMMQMLDDDDDDGLINQSVNQLINQISCLRY